MITLAGRLCRKASLSVPWQGQWVAHVTLDGAAPAGKLELVWGASKLLGSVDATSTGEWQGESQVTLVGGFGWSTVQPAQWIQSDPGLLGSAVATQLAQLAGETLTAPASAFRALRSSYSRRRQTGAATLVDVLALGAAWWVELEGGSAAGTRASPAAPARVEVLELDVGLGRALLDADDVGQVRVGAVIAAAPPRRPRAMRIVEVHADIGDEGQKIKAFVEVL